MQDIRICYIGDSFVNGTGDPSMLGWTGRVSAWSQNEEREITHYNLGVRRETSADILIRWKTECALRFRDEAEYYVVFSFGVNDGVIEEGKARISLEESIANTRAILLEAKALYKVLMVGPVGIDDEKVNRGINVRDEAFEALCREMEISYIKQYYITKESEVFQKEVGANDGAHPREKGYTLMAKSIFEDARWFFS